MNQLIHIWLSVIRWFVTLGVIFWFIVVPLTPIYGLLRPWPNAESKMIESGIVGVPLMIGAATQNIQTQNSGINQWAQERQRSYLILPYSIYSLNIVTYAESINSKSTISYNEIHESSLFILLIPWLAAGGFTAWWFKRFRNRKNAN